MVAKEYTDDDWVADFGLVPKDEDGEWHFDSLDNAKEVAGGNIRRIWTIAQGDGADDRDTEWILPGIRIVNRISFLVSVKEWTDEDINTRAYLWHEYFDSETESEEEEEDMDATGWLLLSRLRNNPSSSVNIKIVDSEGNECRPKTIKGQGGE